MDEFESQEELFFGDLLRQFRLQKKLTQQQLAEQLEVTRETVSLWERGEYKPEVDRILYKIVEVLGLTTQEQQRLFEAYTVTALKTSFHQPPFKRNPYFTGRSIQLKTLHTLLMAGKQVALTQAISGLGGIGKTQLALEYAYRYQKSYHDIFWASADTEEALIASYVRFAEVLHLPEVKEADQTRVKAAVYRWFEMHTNWLLVLDNIEDLYLLPSFVPEHRQGAILLTTRIQVTEPAAQVLELEVLPEEEAILFLLKRSRVLALDGSLADATNDEIEAARVITQLLGNLPLALDQAGAYILEATCSFAEYSVLFQTHRERLLQRRIGESIPTDHPDSVTTTFELNFEQVQQRSSAAADLLRLCAYLAPDAIPEEILTENELVLGPLLAPLASDAFQLNQAIEALRAYSLVRRDRREKTLSVHRLVQAVLQEKMQEEERRTWAERGILAISTVFPRPENENWPQCERLLIQAVTGAQMIEQYQVNSRVAGSFLNKLAAYLQECGRYPAAEPLYKQALYMREQSLGPDHPEVGYLLNNLANLYREQGKYAEAEPLLQRTLRIQIKSLGPDHLDVAYPLTALALLYSLQGKYTKAEPLYQRALQIREQHLVPDHPLVAQPLHRLAELYREQSKHTEAESFYQRTLHIWKHHLGPNHPAVATVLSGLAALYGEQGKYTEAEPLYQQALYILEQHLDPEHPDLSHLLNGLAELYRKQDRYAEAETLYQRALHIWEQRLGPDHPDLATVLNGLANLYSNQGKYGEAKPLYLRALSIREQQLGPGHPDAAATLHDLAVFREQQGNLQEALTLYERALAIREQALGPEHPRTRATRERLTALRALIGHEAGAPPIDDTSLQQRD